VDSPGDLRTLVRLVTDGFTDPREAPVSTAFISAATQDPETARALHTLFMARRDQSSPSPHRCRPAGPPHLGPGTATVPHLRRSYDTAHLHALTSRERCAALGEDSHAGCLGAAAWGMRGQRRFTCDRTYARVVGLTSAPGCPKLAEPAGKRDVIRRPASWKTPQGKLVVDLVCHGPTGCVGPIRLWITVR
jgi:hypothetical protein